MNIDLLDPKSYDNGQPFDQYQWLQQNDPVYRHDEPGDGPGFWAIMRYADAKYVETNPEIFSSSPAVLIPDDIVQGDDVHNQLITEDAPVHTAHRKFLGVELLPGAVREFAPTIDEIVNEVLDLVIELGSCDLIADIAAPIASYVIADMLGLDRDEVVRMYEVGERFMNARTTLEGDGLAAQIEFGESANAVYKSRMAEPRDDVVTRYIQGTWADRSMDELQFQIDYLGMVTAGGDTSRNVIGGGLAALFDFPDQRAKLESGEVSMGSAVEEMLRWVSPITYQRRTVTVDTELGSKKISKGDKVVIFYGAINRDPDAFDDPDKFDVARSPNPHLAFGSGPHKCLGLHLARQEINTAMREILRRMPDIQAAGPATWKRSEAVIAPAIVGPKQLPVSFTAGLKEGSKEPVSS
jgi:cytochrome P450